MEPFIQVGQNILLGIQVIGGIVLAISIGIAAYHFIVGGRQASDIGKSRVVGAIIGFILLMGASALQAWLQSFVHF
jgi:hypothetical protein